MVLLVPIFALLFFVLCWRRPLLAAYVIVAALPAYIITFRVGPLPATFLEMMILILVLVLLVRRRIDWKKIYRQPFFWPLLAILIISLFSALMSGNRWAGLGLWRAYFLEPMIFSACLLSLVKTRRQFYGIFTALGVSALYLSIFSFWQKSSAWGVPAPYLRADGSVDRVTGVFGYPNALGLYLGPVIILFSGWLALGEKKVWPLIFKLTVIVCGFITVLLAQSEAALLAVVAVWFLFLFYFKKTRVLALILLVLAAIILFTTAPIREFVFEKLFLHDWSGLVRRQIWAETWMMLQDHWFLGGGLAGYQAAIAPYHSSANWMEIYLYPHNIIFNFWSELGLLGLLAFIWLGIKYFWENIIDWWRGISREIKILSVTLIAVMLEIIIHGLVDVPFFKNDLAVLFMIILVLAIVRPSLRERESTKIILTRHGETEENKSNTVQGHLPGRLTDIGLRQAEMLAQRLKNEKIDYIYSSDLSRSAETTQEIIKYHPNIKVEFVDQLRERDAGRATGMNFSEISLNDEAYGAESREEMLARAQSFLQRVITEHPGRTVLLVGHAGINKFIQMAICNNRTDFKSVSKQDNTAVSIFEISEDGQHHICLENCSKHLK